MLRYDISKKTYSTDINMVKRKPANENYQMLPFYESVFEPRQNNIDFESAREILLKKDYKMVLKRRFEGVYNMMHCLSYMKNEEIPENEEVFVYAFKHVKTDKVNIYTLIGCESDEIYENNKLFNFRSNKFINKGIELKIFKITGWPFMTLVKRNNFFKIQSIVCS